METHKRNNSIQRTNFRCVVYVHKVGALPIYLKCKIELTERYVKLIVVKFNIANKCRNFIIKNHKSFSLIVAYRKQYIEYCTCTRR